MTSHCFLDFFLNDHVKLRLEYGSLEAREEVGEGLQGYLIRYPSILVWRNHSNVD